MIESIIIRASKIDRQHEQKLISDERFDEMLDDLVDVYSKLILELVENNNPQT